MKNDCMSPFTASIRSHTLVDAVWTRKMCIFAPLSLYGASAFYVYKQWTSWFIEINRWPFIFSKYPKRKRLFTFCVSAVGFDVLPPLLGQTFLLKTEFMCVYVCIVCDTATLPPSDTTIKHDRSHVYFWVRRLPHIKPNRSRLIVAAQTFTFFVYRLRKMCGPVGPWHCALLDLLPPMHFYINYESNVQCLLHRSAQIMIIMDIVCNSRNSSEPHKCVSRAREPRNELCARVYPKKSIC